MRTISAWFDAALTKRFLWASALTWYALHSLMWVAEAIKMHATAATVLNQSDSVYYSAIVESGYAGRNFAFFPLFPMIVRALWLALGRSVAPQIIGATVSTVCVAAFVALTVRWLDVRALRGLVPGSRFAWLTFLLWPASYVLRTHHTEGLFLLLTFVAFVCGRQGRWVAGAIFAGLAALCRNQGVLVAALVAVDVAYRAGSWRRFVAAGAISFAVFLPMPVGDFLASGDALAFYHAQREWTQAHSPIEFARALWLGNPWQRKALGGIVHNVIWLACLPFTWKMRSSSRIQALYAFLSLEIILLQGELVMTFRFVAVVFAFLYFVGDWFGQQRNAVRVPFVLAMLLLALQTTWKYPIGGHAY